MKSLIRCIRHKRYMLPYNHYIPFLSHHKILLLIQKVFILSFPSNRNEMEAFIAHKYNISADPSKGK